jgi:hypothetical protein
MKELEQTPRSHAIPRFNDLGITRTWIGLGIEK